MDDPGVSVSLKKGFRGPNPPTMTASRQLGYRVFALCQVRGELVLCEVRWSISQGVRQSHRVDVPKVVHLAINEHDGNLFEILGPQFGIVVDTHLGERADARLVGQFIENARNNGSGILAQVTPVSADESDLVVDVSLLRTGGP